MCVSTGRRELLGCGAKPHSEDSPRGPSLIVRQIYTMSATFVTSSHDPYLFAIAQGHAQLLGMQVAEDEV
ncbi:hypothetical protein RJZ90_005746 [Blastomyces dermatitidis]